MKALHIINAVAWGLNAVLWFFFAGVPFMGLASLLAMASAVYLARHADAYEYRR